MRNQLEVISKQLKSIRLELCNQGLGVPFYIYPIIGAALQELEDIIVRFYKTIEEADEKKSKRRKNKWAI